MPTLHLHLLGDFRLTLDDMPVTGVNSARLRSLLAYLVLHRDAPQSRQHLAFLFFPDSTESRARANLRNLIHLLRQALPDPNQFLLTDVETVQWEPGAGFTLDVSQFENSVKHAASAKELQDAVDLYRNDLLPNCYDDWILPERERLHQKFIEALQRLALLVEEKGDYASAIQHAQRLLQCDPLREETYRHLMRLHALAGDRAGVVRLYNTCVAVLQRELGVEPSAETRDAYERLLKKDVTSRLPGRVSPPSPSSRRTNLPYALTRFFGREWESDQVKRLVAVNRLVTLTGAGGVGKTRLALKTAADLLDTTVDGVWLVDLAPLSEPALLPQMVASALGVRETPERPLLDSLADCVRQKNMILVLDNCEHLVEAAGQLAETLLHAAPGLRILATSREVLGIAGEAAWRVPSLTVPGSRHPQYAADGRVSAGKNIESNLLQYESVQLFVDRAVEALPTFTLTNENASAVAQICQRMDGIPLAIELAAARVRLLTAEQIAERLDGCFQLLTGGSRTALPRHQTLLGTMDWSHRLLSENEQILFRRLSVFAGGFALEAAEEICAAQGIGQKRILDLLSSLIDKSLVSVAERQEEKGTRYRMLETIRQYAWEKLQESGEKQVVQSRHLDFFLKLAGEADPKLKSAEQRTWLEQLGIEYDNLRAALAWCRTEESDLEAGLRLAGGLWRFWQGRGRLSEGREYLAGVLNRSPAGTSVQSAARGAALNAAAALAYYQGDHISARSSLEEAIAIFRILDDRPGIANSLNLLGNVALSQGDYTGARSMYDEGLTIRRQLGDRWGIARLLCNLGIIARFNSDYTSAFSLVQEGHGLFRELKDSNGIAYTLNMLGDIALDQGDPRAARSFQEESKAIYRELGDKWGLAYALHSSGDLDRSQGDHIAACSFYRESLELFREEGDKWGAAYSLEAFGAIAVAQGESDRATRLFGAAQVLREAIGLPLPPNYRAEYDRNVAVVRTRLNEASFAKAWAEGRAMALEQAIVYALNG